MKSRILIVTPSCHYSSYGAVQQDIYSCISFLRELDIDVRLCTLQAQGQNQSVLEDVKIKHAIEIDVFPISLKKKNLFSILKEPSLLDGAAYAFHTLSISDFFESLLCDFQPEVVIGFGSYSWPLAKIVKSHRARFCVRSHNFEPWHFWEELSILQKMHPLNWLRFVAKYIGEKKAVMASDALGAISPREVVEYARWKSRGILPLPLMSLPYLIRPPKKQEDKPVLDVFFMGATYNVPFHANAARYFLDKVIPNIQKQAPHKFKFHICGSKLPSDLQQKCDGKDVVYEGFLQNLEQFFSSMDAGVFPVWSGRGMKQKIFEALCRSFPVVVPRVALGSYPLVNWTHAIVAENYQEFIHGVVSLQNVELREKLSHGAYGFSCSYFDKTSFKKSLTDFIYGK